MLSLKPKPNPNIGCSSCGYEWHTKSSARLVTCPHCHKLTSNPQFSTSENRLAKETKTNIKCEKCDYEWFTRSLARFVYCPHCLRRISNPKSEFYGKSIRLDRRWFYVKLKCHRCKHVWNAPLGKRKKKVKCPVCAAFLDNPVFEPKISKVYIKKPDDQIKYYFREHHLPSEMLTRALEILYFSRRKLQGKKAGVIAAACIYIAGRGSLLQEDIVKPLMVTSASLRNACKQINRIVPSEWQFKPWVG